MLQPALQKNDKKAKALIITVSVIVFAAVTILGKYNLAGKVDFPFDVHIFATIKVSTEEDGLFLNQLIDLLKKNESPPALKVNAFKSIEKQYFKSYPELISEISLLMDLHREDTRPSIQSLRRYFQKQYSKQLNSLSL